VYVEQNYASIQVASANPNIGLFMSIASFLLTLGLIFTR
jgi:hypothetical protein